MTTGNQTFGGSGVALYSLRTWSGANDPLKRAENAYTLTSIRESRSPGQRYYSGSPTGGPTYYYETTNWAPSLSLWSSNEELALLSKLADKVREDAPDMATALGELPETLSSLSNLLSAAFSGWRSFRKGRFGDAFRSWSRFGSGGGRNTLKFKDVSDAHLALTYGWVPLAGDINDLCEWVEKRTKEPRTLKFRASRTLRVKGQSVGTNGYIPIMADGEIIVGMRMTMTERVSIPRALGLLNPANVAWELVPFSFVVDWFIPIGSYLDSLGFFWGLDYRCTRAVIRRGRARHYPGVYTYAANPYIQIVGGGVTNSTCYFSRIPNYKVSVPRPSLKSMRKAFSLQHVENAAALVWSGIHALRAI